jgi:hypothetical protein
LRRWGLPPASGMIWPGALMNSALLNTRYNYGKPDRGLTTRERFFYGAGKVIQVRACIFHLKFIIYFITTTGGDDSYYLNSTFRITMEDNCKQGQVTANRSTKSVLAR